MYGIVPAPAALDARKVAEEKLRPVLEWDEAELALLMHQLGIAGWTRDRAAGVLRKRGWWLA
jgi:hypothetical protein